MNHGRRARRLEAVEMEVEPLERRLLLTVTDLVTVPAPPVLPGMGPEIRVDTAVVGLLGNTATSLGPLDPARTVPLFSSFEVDVTAYGMPMFAGINMYFRFDSRFVSFAGADASYLLTSTGRALCAFDTFYDPTIDPNVVLVTAVLGGPPIAPLPSGDGVLARLMFDTIAPDTTGLDVAALFLFGITPYGPGLCDWAPVIGGMVDVSEARASAVVGELGTFAPWNVNSTSDDEDLVPGDGVADSDPTLGIVTTTLRSAIQEANALTGPNDITFRIPGGVTGLPPYTISPISALPDLTDMTGGTNIDASTQTGVVLNGASAGAAAGLRVLSANNTVRGLTINGFIGAGIALSGTNANNNTIVGNRIGTDWMGMAAMPNRDGIVITSGRDNRIGGLMESDRNIISGNMLTGVTILGIPATGNRIQGNILGASADPTVALGNGQHGIRILGSASNNLIGGTDAGAGNLIAFNGATLSRNGHGITILSGTGNQIRRNRIHSNAGRGIELGGGSFTLNDRGDTDGGANNQQNFPVVTRVAFTATTRTIEWTLNSIASADYTIEFFSNDMADPSGFGEGRTYLRDRVVRTDANGRVVFSEMFPLTDALIAVTATDANGNTSEFSMVDTDGDALADAWETVGIDINEDGTIDLTLGTNPNHKDLFVEVDAMVGRAPVAGALGDVIAAFAAAPNNLVRNPDGMAGITLHAAIDEAAIPLAAFPNDWVEFDAVKAARFGTAAERASPNAANILAAKRLVYRYTIFADTYGGTTSSGLAELPGNDFMVTLGGWPTPGGTRQEQAGTFMHEFGHTLGLGHGGGDDTNYKPNYHSVMNYIWQTPLIPPAAPTADQLAYAASWTLDYSRGAFANLDETDLDEPVGIGGHAGHRLFVEGTLAYVPEAAAADWNDDGDVTDVNLMIDLNNDGLLTILRGHEDWSKLKYYFLEEAEAADGVHSEDLDAELTAEQWYARSVQEPVDFGDAPDEPYPTLLVDQGAAHVIVPGYHLGALIDAEEDGQPNADASGDDLLDESDDDDGVVFDTGLAQGATAQVTVTATAAGFLDAWIDFNADGDWMDDGEQVFESVALMAGANELLLSVPADAVLGETFARFRFSSVGGLAPTGPATDGEVEDYAVTIVEPPVPGDLNGDRIVDADDIDLLHLALRQGSADPLYDLNGDGMVNSDDAGYLIRDILQTQFGDLNLDRRVNITDLSALAVRFNSPGGWAVGDVTGDGVVGIGDLSRLATFFGFNNAGGGGGSGDTLDVVDLLREAGESRRSGVAARSTVVVPPAKAPSAPADAPAADTWHYILAALRGAV